MVNIMNLILLGKELPFLYIIEIYLEQIQAQNFIKIQAVILHYGGLNLSCHVLPKKMNVFVNSL